jgi:hypothetical protein
VHQGKVRVIGTSNFPAEQIVEAQWTAERWGFERFRCHQAPYSLFRRGIERGVLPVCDRYGIGVMTWGPLNGGWLSGRFRAPEDLAGSTRFAKVTRRTNDLDPADEVNRRRFELVGRLHALAAEAGLSVAHLATAFAGEHPVVSSVIIGPRTMGQLEDSLAAAGLRLGDDLLDALMSWPGRVRTFTPSCLCRRGCLPAWRRLTGAGLCGKCRMRDCDRGAAGGAGPGWRGDRCDGGRAGWRRVFSPRMMSVRCGWPGGSVPGPSASRVPG